MWMQGVYQSKRKVGQCLKSQELLLWGAIEPRGSGESLREVKQEYEAPCSVSFHMALNS